MALVIIASAAAVLVLSLIVLSLIGTQQFRSRYATEKGELLRRARAAAPSAAPPTSPAGLPPPLSRYLEVTGGADRPALRLAILEQRGALRAAADKPWMPFTAEQVYSLEPPGFVWLATARMAPSVHLLARDRFVAGEGSMLVSLLGAFTLVDARGPELDQGAGLRYWGEILAFPEVVRSPYLRWEAVSARRARLLVTQGGLTLQAEVEFDEEGLPVGVHADRYRDVDGASVLTPWSGHLRDWKKLGGRLFPTRWEAVWHLPEGELSAVKLEILGLRTE